MPNARYLLASRDIAVKLVRNSSTAGGAGSEPQEARSHFDPGESPPSTGTSFFDHDNDGKSRSVDTSLWSMIVRLLRRLVKVD